MKPASPPTPPPSPWSAQPPAAPPAPAFADAAETGNRRFGSDGFLFGTEPNAWLKEQAHHWPAGARVPCVADGEGCNSV